MLPPTPPRRREQEQRAHERGVISLPVYRVTADTLQAMIKAHVDPAARIMTDEFSSYRGLAKSFAGHETVAHTKKEYVRGDVSTNTVEGYFALLKRGIYGTFHHVQAKHLWRYAREFDFRWNERRVNDGTRAHRAISQAGGRRLMYKHLITKDLYGTLGRWQ